MIDTCSQVLFWGKYIWGINTSQCYCFSRFKTQDLIIVTLLHTTVHLIWYADHNLGNGKLYKKVMYIFYQESQSIFRKEAIFFFRTPLILSILNCVKVKYLYLGKLAFCYWVIVRKLRLTGFNPALELVKCEISDTVFSFYLNFLITINTFINSMVIKHICDVLLTFPPPQVEKQRNSDEDDELRIKEAGYELKLVVSNLGL